MPNWVSNHLTIYGENAVEVLRSLLVKSEDNDCGYELDFNKIIPMPEELNIESGSVTRDCAKLYVNAMLEGCDAYKKYAALYVQAFGKDVAMSEDEQIKTMQYALLHKDFMEQHNISTAEELFEALGKDNQNGGNGKGGYSM